jgi:hypothetical protein
LVLTVGFEFYLSGCTSYRCLQKVILAVIQLVIVINILRREDRDRVSSRLDHVPTRLDRTPLAAQEEQHPADQLSTSHRSISRFTQQIEVKLWE